MPSPPVKAPIAEKEPERHVRNNEVWREDYTSYQPPAPASGMYWSRYKKAMPHALRGHSVNLVGDQLYVFGGANQKTYYNKLYIMDMDTLTWRQPNTLGPSPSPCRGHSTNVIECQVGSRKSAHLIVFGGGNGPHYFNDIYTLNCGMTGQKKTRGNLFSPSIDTLTWSQPRVKGRVCSPRRAHVTCVWRKKIVVVGGGDGDRPLADVHMLDIANPEEVTWATLAPTGDAPVARGYHTGNLVGHRLVVFGGSDGMECFSDLYVLDLEKCHWTAVSLSQSIPRFAHTATQVGSYLFIVGGHNGGVYSSDVLVLNLVTMAWESRKIYGAVPPARGYHSAVLYDSRLYVLGGYDGRRVYDDLVMLELSSCAYLPQITNFDIDLSELQE
ncbi:galactose oxidase [Hesseltinella vesiculosa]|uniref:Galactose oxidase n=1 Tax=Hesseltinella vesiculosa TaxID=101127 RepID=A0A1X2GRS2_9FUNG|nr:galactose oxidase [Hesseltinella vesiculosa]